MKHAIFLAAILGAASICAAAPAKKSTNVNDGFNRKWNSWQRNTVKAAYSLNKNEGVTAKNALQITTSTPGSACYLKRFTVEPMSFYTVEVMAKSDTAGAITTLVIQDFGTKNKYTGTLGKQSFTVSKDWKKNQYFFKTGKNTEKVQILISFTSPKGGTVLFDDFKMTKVDYIKGFTDTFAENTWAFWKYPKAKMKSSFDKTTGHTTPGSVKIDVLPGNTLKKFSGSVHKHIPVIRGKKYTLSAYVKTKGLDPDALVSIAFQGKDQKLKFLGLPVFTSTLKASECTDWKRIVVTGKIEDTGKWQQVQNIIVTLGVRTSKNPGSAWFDDFEFSVE